MWACPSSSRGLSTSPTRNRNRNPSFSLRAKLRFWRRLRLSTRIRARLRAVCQPSRCNRARGRLQCRMERLRMEVGRSTNCRRLMMR